VAEAPVRFMFEGRLLEVAEIRGRGTVALRPEGGRLVRVPLTDDELRHALADGRFFHGRVRVTVEVFEREGAQGQ
jgi:hypothetical protein